jgi:glyoxylase-like metal-dependent hydrolase (beta-lactamase superfamily II)
VYDLSGEPFFGFDAVRSLRGLPPELLMVPLSGHSEGHCGIAVLGEQGWLLHAGDAYIHHGTMANPPGKPPFVERMIDRFNSWDRREIERNRARLRELVHDPKADVHVFCSHDPQEFHACCAR